MRSFVHVLVGLVVLGCLVNIGIAAWLAMSVDPQPLTRLGLQDYLAPDADDKKLWAERVDSTEATEVLLVHELRRRGVSVRTVAGSDYGVYRFAPTLSGGQTIVNRMFDADWTRLMTMRAGWPFPALRGARFEHDVPEPRITAGAPLPPGKSFEYQGALPINRGREYDWRFVPFMPLPAGFAANSLVYAILLSIPFWPFWIRRAVIWYRTPPESAAALRAAERQAQSATTAE